MPKIRPGDVLLVDHAGAPEFKLFDLNEQAFERVAKKPSKPAGELVCTCPAASILAGRGCSCAAAAAA